MSGQISAMSFWQIGGFEEDRELANTKERQTSHQIVKQGADTTILTLIVKKKSNNTNVNSWLNMINIVFNVLLFSDDMAILGSSSAAAQWHLYHISFAIIEAYFNTAKIKIIKYRKRGWIKIK